MFHTPKLCETYKKSQQNCATTDNPRQEHPIPSKIVPPGPQWLEKKGREATAAGGGPFGAAGAVAGGAAGGAPLGKDAYIGIILGLSWDYIGPYWGYVGGILGLYWVILGLYWGWRSLCFEQNGAVSFCPNKRRINRMSVAVTWSALLLRPSICPSHPSPLQ